MAVGIPQDLNGFLPLLSTSDIKMKITVGSKLFTYLDEPSNLIECSDIGIFIDNLVQWLSNNNPKVIQYGIEIITQLINRLRTDFRPYISSILPLIIDRLGDCKESIKVKAFFLIMKSMECDVIIPQALFDKISANAFYHKNSNVKEGSMNLLLSTIEEFGANSINILKIVPMIIKLLSDANVQVRQKAFETLVDLYKHVGEKLRVDIQKKNVIPQNKITDLMNKFDEVKASGDLLPTAIVDFSLANNDETDHTHPLVSRKHSLSNIKKPSSFYYKYSTTPLQRLESVQKSLPVSFISSHAGAVDEDTFIQSFENVPTIKIYNARDLDDTMKKIHKSIQNGNEQWNKRVDSLKIIRALVLTGAMEYLEFFNNLRYLEHSFQIAVKDLRSQVVRETCITIAFLSQRLGNKFNHFAEFIFSNLIDLIPNAAKVTASSGLVAISFILEHTHAPRIIPILANNLGSKSKVIRRACCEFFDQILRTWQPQILEKHITILQDSIEKGIVDADSNARVFSRKAYWGFCEHFPEQGEVLLNKLDPIYQKVLLKNSGSNLCFSKCITDEVIPSHCSVNSQHRISMRSNSAMDLQADQRTKTHTKYAMLSKQKVNLTIPPQYYVTVKTKEDLNQIERNRSSRSRLSISQPSSRTGSPSSKYMVDQQKPKRNNSGIPRSQNTSRESSPNRFSSIASNLNSRQSLIFPMSKPETVQTLSLHSQEGKSALTNSLGSIAVHKSSRKILRKSLNYYSDESICSERSNDSYKPTSDSFNWNESQNYSDEIWKNLSLDIEDIISNCEGSNWNSRKEGLVSLQKYLQQGHIINKASLKRLTDIFTKMFMDSQTKVISLFLDVLNELIVTHNQYLEYWLYVLLVKLFNKVGSDILSSVYSKILRTMEIIRLSFSCDFQLIAVFKYLTDPAQTPNVKVKIFAMNYISKLASTTDLGSEFCFAVDGKKDYATLALIKIIGWTMGNNIKQGPELRRVAQEALQALYNLNASQITLRLSQLPEEYQKVLYGLFQIRMRRNSVDKLISRKYHNRQLPNQPTSLASPPLQSDDTVDSNKISKSLKQTTIEVQKSDLKCYMLEKNDVSNDSASQISLITEIDNRNFNKYYSNDTTPNIIIKILEDLEKDTLELNYKKSILNHLNEIIKDKPSDVLMSNFKKMIKVILKLFMDIEPIIREQAIILMTCLVRNQKIITCFYNFIELIIFKVLNMCCDPCKPVIKVAEDCAFELSVSLQPELVIRIITPLMSAKEIPINLMAIKMMNKLIEKYGSNPVAVEIKEIVSHLLKSYDNPDSAIRKSAVFCLVSLHKVFGKQEFLPHISSLNGPKLKLLNVYIERAQKSTPMLLGTYS